MDDFLYEKLFRAIDAKTDSLISLLSESVAIESVSAEPARRGEVLRMMDWTKQHLEKLGAQCSLVPIGDQKLPDGSILGLPPLIFGQLGDDLKKKTVLLYAHLDVQPAAKEDGWDTEPFVLTEIDGKLFGRGSTDDKGPMIAWLVAIKTLQELNIEIPVNIKYKDTFLSGVSYTCISDNYWLGKNKPCITYGLRHEAMNDLVWVLGQLTDVKGNIKIPGVMDLVAPCSESEESLYAKMDFDKDVYASDIGAHSLVHPNKEETLKAKMRQPCLSIHGIEGGFSGVGAKTVIPAKVIGKFSIRIVPNMEPEEVNRLVLEYLESLWKLRGSPNQFKPTAYHSGKCWVGDFQDGNFQAGARALKRGLKQGVFEPALSLKKSMELVSRSVVLLPIGAADDMAHSQNEKINKSNLVQGTKALAAYLLELASA